MRLFFGAWWWCGRTRARIAPRERISISPLPARGERSSVARVRGPLRDSEHRIVTRAAKPPHPDPLPARGERERAEIAKSISLVHLILRCPRPAEASPFEAQRFALSASG